MSHNEPSRPIEPGQRPKRAVVILEPDLFFSPRLEDVVRAHGGRPVTVETPPAFREAIDNSDPALALLDLATPGNWELTIRQLKGSPETKHVPIIAFGSHVDVETLAKARRAGVDHAWARSRMMEELVEVVDRHLNPPIRYPEGWDEPLSKLAVAGLSEFNRGEYFEQHEYLELAWLEEKRPIRDLYQGILQVGVALLQIERGSWRGATKLLRRGLPKLRPLPPECRGIELAPLRDWAESLLLDLTEAGPDALTTQDIGRFPMIEFENPYDGETPAELGVEIEADH